MFYSAFLTELRSEFVVLQLFLALDRSQAASRERLTLFPWKSSSFSEDEELAFRLAISPRSSPAFVNGLDHACEHFSSAEPVW